MPVYNAEALLKESIDKTSTDFEQLLDDDSTGKTDENVPTDEILHELRKQGYTTIKTKG